MQLATYVHHEEGKSAKSIITVLNLKCKSVIYFK